jgi:histidinol-phosphatase (PHP family)
LIFNLHTHTRYSDGSDDPEKYVEEAIKQGFHTLGFSDHSPVPFENTFAIREGMLGEYCNAITSLPSPQPPPPWRRGRGGGVTQILLGLEVDFIPGITQPIDYYRKNFSFDYFIGSVHFVKSLNSNELWFIDGPNIEIYDHGLKVIFGGNIRKAVTTYYRQLNELIVNEKPDIIGHLDKIKMYNRDRYFSESDIWYVVLVDETLDLARKSGCVIEVNTRGIYKKRSESLFPGTETLKKIRDHKIPITLSSDAHKPSELSLYFPEAKKILTDLGFKNLVLKNKDGWADVPL